MRKKEKKPVRITLDGLKTLGDFRIVKGNDGKIYLEGPLDSHVGQRPRALFISGINTFAYVTAIEAMAALIPAPELLSGGAEAFLNKARVASKQVWDHAS